MSDSAVLPVRCLSGQWQVLFDDPKLRQWVPVDSEREAKLLARARTTWEDALNGELRGSKVSEELIAISEIIDRIIGSCMAARICRRAAEKALK